MPCIKGNLIRHFCTTFALTFALVASAQAADVIAEWSSVKPPPAPELKPVKLEGKTTALLILDLQRPSCTMQRRVRCVDTIPKVKKLHDAARAASAIVIYTFAGAGDPHEIADPSFAPRDGEWMAQRGPRQIPRLRS